MEEIDLRRVAKTAYNKKWYIVCIMIVSLTLGYLYSFIYNVPKYESSTTIVLAQITPSQEMLQNNSITQTDITMNKDLVDTYTEIIKSKKILKEVKENLKLDISEDDLYKMVSVTSGTNTEILAIKVITEEPELSQKIANETARVFSEKVAEIYKINNVYVMDEAEIADVPCNINHMKDMAIFGIFGIFISCGLILIIYMFDTTIKQEEDVEETVGLPVVGIIPLLENNKEDNKQKDSKSQRRKKLAVENIDLPTTEAFRTLRTNITFGKNSKQLKNILITSSITSEGKSFVSANLAVALARSNKKVLLLDADMRKGRQHEIFKIDNQKGLSDCLDEIQKINESTISKFIKTTRIPNLHIITSGSRLNNPSELIASNKLIEILNVLNEIYDIVIIDGTPSMLVSDSVAISKYVKNVLVVVAHRFSKIENLKKLKKSFENVGSSISGVILNKFPVEESAFGGKGYYSSKGYYSNENSKEKNEQKIQSVEEVILESQKNKPYENDDDKQNNEIAKINNKESEEMFSRSDNVMYYKLENITQELNNMKNLFIQYAMNNSGVSKDDLLNIKDEIADMKRMIENNSSVEISETIKEEVEAIKETTNALIDEQNRNSEKIRKFIENYKNRNS